MNPSLAPVTVSDDRLIESFEAELTEVHNTPHRLFLADIARESFRAVAARAAQIPKLSVAYSVKTNPRAEMLRYALEAGFLAEVISEDEYDLASANGFAPADVIYNGPRPLERGRVGIAFADSVESLERYCVQERSAVAGVRFRPSHIPSRFGVPWDGLERCAQIVRESSAESVALHFHVRPEDFGVRSWGDIAAEALRAARMLAERSGKRLLHLDLGGGWTPQGLERDLDSTLPSFVAKVRSEVEHIEHVIIEPGQSIATPVEAIVTRVLEIRRRGRFCEAIVDTGYPDLPQMRTFAHRMFYLRGAEVLRLPDGRERIAGSTCLEYDVLHDGVRVADFLARGDVLVVADAGAYDASMSFAFAHGERRAAV